jgi:hypothetical protein
VDFGWKRINFQTKPVGPYGIYGRSNHWKLHQTWPIWKWTTVVLQEFMVQSQYRPISCGVPRIFKLWLIPAHMKKIWEWRMQLSGKIPIFQSRIGCSARRSLLKRSAFLSTVLRARGDSRWGRHKNWIEKLGPWTTIDPKTRIAYNSVRCANLLQICIYIYI